MSYSMEGSISSQPLEIFKWVGLAFAAGLIGYFGRYLAMHLIDKFRKRKPESSRPAETARVTIVSEADKSEEEKLKLGKKKLKLEQKKAKKSVKEKPPG